MFASSSLSGAFPVWAPFCRFAMMRLALWGTMDLICRCTRRFWIPSFSSRKSQAFGSPCFPLSEDTLTLMIYHSWCFGVSVSLNEKSDMMILCIGGLSVSTIDTKIRNENTVGTVWLSVMPTHTFVTWLSFPQALSLRFPCSHLFQMWLIGSMLNRSCCWHGNCTMSNFVGIFDFPGHQRAGCPCGGDIVAARCNYEQVLSEAQSHGVRFSQQLVDEYQNCVFMGMSVFGWKAICNGDSITSFAWFKNKSFYVCDWNIKHSFSAMCASASMCFWSINVPSTAMGISHVLVSLITLPNATLSYGKLCCYDMITSTEDSGARVSIDNSICSRIS